MNKKVNKQILLQNMSNMKQIDFSIPEVLRSSDGEILKTLSTTYESAFYRTDEISDKEVERLIMSNQYYNNSKLVVMPTEIAEKLLDMFQR